MAFDSIVNRGDFFSAHFLAEVLPKELKGKDGPFRRWTEREKAERERAKREETRPEPVTPRMGLRAFGSRYFGERAFFADHVERAREGGVRPAEAAVYADRLHALHVELLTALGYAAKPHPAPWEVEIGDRTVEVPVAMREPGIAAVECGWAPEADAAMDTDGAGRLLTPVEVSSQEHYVLGTKLATWLFANDEQLRYVLLLAGGVVVLADRALWGEGRYLAVSLDAALGRNSDDEIGMVAALLGAERLRLPEEGGADPLAQLGEASRAHAVGVSTDLRNGLQASVEIIANEVLDRLRAQGLTPDRLADSPKAFADELARQSLRYLYRILFLLYAEARPELGVVPAKDEAYIQGYSMARLGDLVAHDLVGEEARTGFHLYESLDVLFRMVDQGHRPRGRVLTEEEAEGLSEGEGLRFEPLKADLFDPERTNLIGRGLVHPDDNPDEPRLPRLDTRLRDEALYTVLRRLMLAKGRRKERGGFISYAQLGINQLGAVYEGLMSYTGFIAEEELYEVAKNGDPKDGSWLVPHSRADDFEDGVFVKVRDEDGTPTDERVVYRPGSFVYRLAGRDRETSASYYTPESLTRLTVELTLRERLDQDGRTTPARELLEWTICEPALGSGAFLNEAINQVAEEYLKRREQELDERLDPEVRREELQKAKAYIALHNSYGVDLNDTAVELAEVSLWLNVMHQGLQAPWFGLHLRRGNSLVGCGRRFYAPDQLKLKAWLKAAPVDHPFREGRRPEGHIHHFLLPAHGWGVASAEKEAKNLAPESAKQLGKWRNQMRKQPTGGNGKKSQTNRLKALAGRVEYLWDLVIRRLEISEREISRRIDVWGAEGIDQPQDAVPREKVLADLQREGTPFWRLKTLMDTWCALWFWPVQAAGMLDGTDEEYARLGAIGEISGPGGEGSLFGTQRAGTPLRDLGDWLDFAEALLGTADIPDDSLFSDLATLADLDHAEDQLPLLMGMEAEYKLGERFPWLRTAEEIAEKQGFFHWELHFAQVFARGGFDIQVGNPPWVRPRWDEKAVLAEMNPWFKLADKPDVEKFNERKRRVLGSAEATGYFLDELTGVAGMSQFLSDEATYELIAGTQPDLYRGFMVRVWRNQGESGSSGLIHPDSHFGGVRERNIREQSYRHLRFHAHFHNRAGVFPDIHANSEFAIQVYSRPRGAGFYHSSWMFSPETLVRSIEGEGGELPGIKNSGNWDMRPHPARLLWVDSKKIAEWSALSGGGSPVEQSPLLYPVTTAEDGAIRAFATYPRHLESYAPNISRGFDEANTKKDGLIRWETKQSESLDEVVLQGPHFGIATPLSKQPNIPCKTNRDWSAWDLTELPTDAVPVSNYQRACSSERYLSEQDIWGQYRYTEYYRLAWRNMIPFDTERSLFATLIPPGPAHVDAVHSMALAGNHATVLNNGFWAALPLDYLLRITGRSHLRRAEVERMPAPGDGHPLENALLLRTLRLNCLTNAYAPLWAELYQESWQGEPWAVDWPDLPPLTAVSSEWGPTTPLRTERERRSALVEIDALVSVWLGITADQLVAVYKSRYPVLSDYEGATWFDANGRKIAGNHNTYGHGQTKEHYLQLQDYLESGNPDDIPEGYEDPFHEADRESEYRQAHAYFTERAERAQANGEWDGTL
ncbi:MAG: class I SAM-dependent DNA methyltransferase [Nocardiopsaceae bacterium]|nr:class I SAM-dependent DNA methyltransferase [Nocardiopsaceae bacterium]